MLRDDDSEGGNCSDSDSLHPPDKLQFLEPLVRFEYPTQHEIWNLPSYRNNLVDNPRKTHTSFITSFNGFCKLTALASILTWHVEKTSNINISYVISSFLD